MDLWIAVLNDRAYVLRAWCEQDAFDAVDKHLPPGPWCLSSNISGYQFIIMDDEAIAVATKKAPTNTQA